MHGACLLTWHTWVIISVHFFKKNDINFKTKYMHAYDTIRAQYVHACNRSACYFYCIRQSALRGCYYFAERTERSVFVFFCFLYIFSPFRSVLHTKMRNAVTSIDDMLQNLSWMIPWGSATSILKMHRIKETRSGSVLSASNPYNTVCLILQVSIPVILYWYDEFASCQCKCILPNIYIDNSKNHHCQYYHSINVCPLANRRNVNTMEYK